MKIISIKWLREHAMPFVFSLFVGSLTYQTAAPTPAYSFVRNFSWFDSEVHHSTDGKTFAIVDTQYGEQTYSSKRPATRFP